MVTVCRLILQSGVPGIYFRRNRLLTLQPDTPRSRGSGRMTQTGSSESPGTVAGDHLADFPITALKWRSRPLPEFIVVLDAINVINGRQRRISLTSRRGGSTPTVFHLDLEDLSATETYKAKWIALVMRPAPAAKRRQNLDSNLAAELVSAARCTSPAGMAQL